MVSNSILIDTNKVSWAYINILFQRENLWLERHTKMEANTVSVCPPTLPAYAVLRDVLALVSLGFHFGSRKLGKTNGLVLCD